MIFLALSIENFKAVETKLVLALAKRLLGFWLVNARVWLNPDWV